MDSSRFLQQFKNTKQKDKNKTAECFSCKFLKNWKGIRREEHGSICFGAVQRCPTAVFHLGMGGRGGAPRVPLFVLLG